MLRLPTLLALLTFLAMPAAAQSGFSVDAYRSFLQVNRDLPVDALEQMHSAGAFQLRAPTHFSAAGFSTAVDDHFQLTPSESELLARHGFMVTERRSFESFGNGFLEIYEHDLPVFVSTDAILHAFHMSYDRILMDTEAEVLLPRLDALLSALHAALPALAERYAGLPDLEEPLRDADVYLTIPRILLSDEPVDPIFAGSRSTIDDLLALIAAEDMAEYPLFAENCRQLDFSQFTVRGHYTQDARLARYFQAMMWLGRTEIYLIGPQTQHPCTPSESDVQRQAILALLLAEAADLSGGHDLLAAYDEVIQLFVGEPDNVTLPHLDWLRNETGVERAPDLLDAAQFEAFQQVLAEQAWAEQKILSQILVNQTQVPDAIRPASAFMLLGQRFVIDSYVTGSVVYDKIDHQGSAVKRMLPSTLDVLFALGNDAAGQLLEDELERYHYADNLAALRYLIDAYDDEFWMQSMYNGWLASIRTLNPPDEAARGALPAFMQTAAWWQQKMNTQLAAWAQLRHDNLLYAKQSYTGVPGCSFPFSYVEPIPAFYETIATLARSGAERFQVLQSADGFSVDEIRRYFTFMAGVNDTLAVIAQKELDGASLSTDESAFLARMLFKEVVGCYEEVNGWYPQLFYADVARSREPDMVVADIHTAPADENGIYVGWVLHAGTGPLNLAVVVADVPGEGPVAFVGPVMSYYERLTRDFERLTDEAWQTAYRSAQRPSFVNLYLADAEGGTRGASASLTTTSAESTPDDVTSRNAPTLEAYPNPFNSSTAFSFTLRPKDGHRAVSLSVYDVQGRQVRRLVDEPLPPGNFTVRWDGTMEDGSPAASGVYFARLRTGDAVSTTGVTLVR